MVLGACAACPFLSSLDNGISLDECGKVNCGSDPPTQGKATVGVIVPVGEYTATFVFSCNGTIKTPTWSLGFRYIGGATPPLPEQAAETIREIWSDTTPPYGGPFKPALMATQWTFEGVSVALQDDDGPIVGQAFTPTAGTLSGAPMPINCAILLNKSTARGGRKYRGRAYVPPVYPLEGDVGPVGEIAPSLLANLNPVYNNAYNAMDDVDLEPVLHHSDGAIGTRITSMTVGSIIATQRRRLR